jgi:eukaryotic-like serine/threonine-protein kinase
MVSMQTKNDGAPMSADTFELASAAAVSVTAAWLPLAALVGAAGSPRAAVWVVVAAAIAILLRRAVRGREAAFAVVAPSARRLGPYVLETLIGAGGFGEVYRAHHEGLGRPAAVKVLSPDRISAPDLARFEREVELTSSLKHPNTVSVYDSGHAADGMPYYAMELLDGVDLEALVSETGPLEPARVVRILEQVCDALADVHDRGLVHRDVKPANIVLCDRDDAPDLVKLVDFGLAKHALTDDLGLSGEGLLGTPLYLSPEAILAPDEVDARSDLYALGAVAYFLLTAKPLFEGKNLFAVCRQHVHDAPIAPSDRIDRDLPADLEDLVLRCLEKRPEDRPASARELRALLPKWSNADDHPKSVAGQSSAIIAAKHTSQSAPEEVI